MKLHRIETVNLNSLYGAHAVDLDDTLAGGSLFLIHGPTGSGKSTLMDAVSLALFGVTPRLDASHGNETADPRGVMSRGTGECSARVMFSKIEPGGRQGYRATWSCWRSRKKADAAFQRVERSVERRTADGGWELMVSSSKRKEYGPVFHEVLEGFGVNDFNRSMLLAQGQFDAFLGAAPEQRAEILERLTDTSIYQELGLRAARIHRRHAQRVGALRTLAAAGGGLDPEALQRLEQEHAGHDQQLQRMQTELAQATGRLQWFDGDLERRARLAQAAAQQGLLQADLSEAAPTLVALAEHERCEGSKAFWLLDLARSSLRQVSDLAGKVAELRASLPELQAAAETADRRAGATAAARPT